MAFPTNDIKKLVASGYPIIYLVSFDENYVETAVMNLGQQLLGEKFQFHHWSAENVEMGSDCSDSLNKAISSFETGFLFVKDLNFYLSEPKTMRKLKDFYNSRIGKTGKRS